MKKTALFFVLAMFVAAGGALAAELAYHAPKGAGFADAGRETKPIKLTVTTTHKPGSAAAQLEQCMLQVFGEDAPEGMFEFAMYDSGVLYKSDAELPALIAGEVDMSFISPAWMYDNGLSWFNMLDMGYLFDSVAHLDAVCDPATEIGKRIQQAIWDEFHIMSFGVEYIGARNVWLAKDREITGPDDLVGIKLRMPTGASYVQLGNALGFNVTPLDVSEIYLAMETGLIEGHENQIFSTYTNGQFECAETLVFTEHMLGSMFVMLSGGAWEKMTAEQQGIFYACMRKAVALANKWVVDTEKKYIDIAEKDFSIRLQYPDKAAIKEKVQAFYLNNAAYSSKWDIDLLERINRLAEEMR